MCFWTPRNSRKPASKYRETQTCTQRVQSTSIVECRVSVLGIVIMILGKYPPEQYLGPFGVGLLSLHLSTL